MALPTGLVTFIFAEIEGSTRLAQQLGAGYRAVLTHHRTLLRGVLRLHHGVEVSSHGESSFAVFPDAGSALRSARSAQTALERTAWPAGDGAARPQLRIGIHSGYARPRGGEYASPEVHRTARIAAAAHGGQVLCSAGTARAADPLPDPLALWDLGLFRLRGFDHRERLFQLVAPGWQRQFPQPRTEPAAPHNLPVAAASFVGRRAEQARLARLLAEHRLVTLVGPGGVGKSRLAVQVAGELAGGYRNGVRYLNLAAGPADLAAGPPELAAGPPHLAAGPPHLAAGSANLAAAGAGELLLVLDGCPPPDPGLAATVSRLLGSDPGVRVLATAHRPLGVPGERSWRLPPLSLRPAPDGEPGEAAVLLADRVAAARGGCPVPAAELPDLARVAARLHGLPLALEQAAGQLRALAAGQLATRLATQLATRPVTRPESSLLRTVGRGHRDGSYQCPAPSWTSWEGDPTCTRRPRT